MFLKRLAPINPRKMNNVRRFTSEIDKLKIEGFTEEEAKDILFRIDEELEKLTADLATQDQFKKLQSQFK